MTKEQKLQAYSMRKNGKTYRAIADVFNTTAANMRLKLMRFEKSLSVPPNPKKLLAIELRKTGSTYQAISEKINVSINTVYDWAHRVKTSKINITVLAIHAGMNPITVHKRIKKGMTLEQALTHPLYERLEND